MKRLTILAAVLFLAVSYAYAQSARNAAYNHEGKSNFSNISTQGLDVTGNPGYLEMRAITGNASNNTDAKETYYLWVDETGDLCMASYTTISTYSSFPTGSWGGTNNNFPCVKVGGQS